MEVYSTDHTELLVSSVVMISYLEPEVLIQSSGNHTPLKQNHHPLVVPSLNLKIQVVLPVLQLGFLQRFHMEIWPLYL